jgi:cruciform cutting endonuclease 1
MPLAEKQSTAWLSKLTLPLLRRVAFLIGAPSSGTKPALTRQIRQELGACNATTARKRSQKSTLVRTTDSLSIVSIDMGIRNLAYAHLVAFPATSADSMNGAESPKHLRPNLLAWKRVVISGAPNGVVASTGHQTEYQSSHDLAAVPLQVAEETPNKDVVLKLEKEAFDPSTFAIYAYDFVKGILDTHHPTHVLIERQRFRSGGASAVQEWTIRVGVFEGMLHAALKTLSEEHRLPLIVKGVDPGRVTRYWLEGRAVKGKERTSSGKESKKAKIDVVGNSFTSAGAAALVDVNSGSNQGRRHGVEKVVDAFLARWQKKSGSPRSGVAKDLLKLDDLADCLLQGVAWLNWQSKKEEVLRRGLEAFAEDSLFKSARQRKSIRLPIELSAAKQKRALHSSPVRPSSSDPGALTVFD